MNLNLRTRGFTLIELLVILVIVGVVGYFVYGHWFAESQNSEPLPASAPVPKLHSGQTIGKITLLPDRREEVAQTKEYRLAEGIPTKARREHSFTHTINVQWQALGEMTLSAGIKNLVDTTIKAEISRTKGHDFQESLTDEEIATLVGEKNADFEVTWTDTWQKGNIEVLDGGSKNGRHVIPFEYREKTSYEIKRIPKEQ